MVAYDLTTVFNSYKYICDSNFVGKKNSTKVKRPKCKIATMVSLHIRFYSYIWHRVFSVTNAAMHPKCIVLFFTICLIFRNQGKPKYLQSIDI
jgi:hypothetical protein